MIEPGESGIDRQALERFLEVLPELDSLGLFPERFTLEIRTRGGLHLLHVSRPRAVIRPVIPEDSRKRLISLPRSQFVRLVEHGNPALWQEALDSGLISIK